MIEKENEIDHNDTIMEESSMDSEELSSSNMDEDSGDLSCTVDISSTEERMRKLVTNNQKKKDHDLTPVHSDSDFKGN